MKDGTITWTVDELKAGESIIVSFTVTVPSVEKDTAWNNVATVVFENDPTDPEKPEESNEVTVEEKAPTEEPKENNSTGNSAPQTGDNTSVAMWSTFAFASLMVCGVLLINEKKKKAYEIE